MSDSTFFVSPPFQLQGGSSVTATKLYGPQADGSFSEGLELSIQGIDWSTTSLLQLVRPGTPLYMVAGRSLPSPLPDFTVEKDTFLINPEPKFLEELIKLFKRHHKPAPVAFLYENIKILYNGDEIGKLNHPRQVVEWYRAGASSDATQKSHLLRNLSGALQIAPFADPLGIKVLSTEGHYIDPVTVFKFLQRHADEGIYNLGEGFDDFCDLLQDGVIIEIRNEWDQPYQGEVRVELPVEDASTAPPMLTRTLQENEKGIVRLTGSSDLRAGRHIISFNDSHKKITAYEGAESKVTHVFELQANRLSEYVYIQVIDLSKWFVVEEFGHLYTEGNQAAFFIDGKDYFHRIHELLQQPFDYVFFTNWRLDYDFDLEEIPPGTPQDAYHSRPSTIGRLLSNSSQRDKVYGILWEQKSPTSDFVYNNEWNVNLNAFIALNRGILYTNDPPARHLRILIDSYPSQKEFTFSHHQKTFVIKRPGQALIAFCGGLDLAFQRWDTSGHTRRSSNRFLPNPLSHPKAINFILDNREPLRVTDGNIPLQPWHDVHVEICGPATLDIDANFRDRWQDTVLNSDPFKWKSLGEQIDIENGQSFITLKNFNKAELPPSLSAIERVGQSYVRIARTYRTRNTFTLMQNIINCIRRAMRLIYIEDQYLTSTHIAEELKRRLESNNELAVIIVTGERPDQPYAITSRNRFLSILEYHRFATQLGIYHLKNKQEVDPSSKEQGIYVHSKLIIVDDIWVSISSCNLNDRSLTTDTELGALIVDGELHFGRRKFAFDLRKKLWEEHFGKKEISPVELLDETKAIILWEEAVKDKNNSHVTSLKIDPSEERALPTQWLRYANLHESTEDLNKWVVNPWGASETGIPDPDHPNDPTKNFKEKR